MANEVFLPFLFGFLFFIYSFFSISDYGINWDEPIHFYRGQAYLNFFSSVGQKTYGDLGNQRTSVYKDRNHEPVYYLSNDCCHPVLNGILYSLSNKIFFERLGLLPDIEAYSLMGIMLSSFLVFLLTWFVVSEFNVISGIIAGVSLFIYPVFLAETHFNVKDPPETVFYATCLILIYYAVKKLSWKMLILAGIFFGLAWGSKFNILFLPILIIPWLIFHFFINKNNALFKRLQTKLFFLLIIPIIVILGFVIFFASWPYLWQSPIDNMISVFAWYKHIGTSTNYESEFLFFGFNIYPIVWIIFTTPLAILILSAIGVIESLQTIAKKDKKKSLLLLVLLWFFVPIVRASLPNASIYGGVRQIMEYIPAMAVLSGIGVSSLNKRFKSKNLRFFLSVLIACLFIFNVLEIVKIHPNETVYFNQLAGGLKGAYRKNIPEAGGDLGNVYKQGIDWVNGHAEKNSKLTLLNNGISAIPSVFIRKDISFSYDYWSGQEQKGEYIMSTTQVGWDSVLPDKANYLKNSLKPIFEIKVDGAPILKIWKNEKIFK